MSSNEPQNSYGDVRMSMGMDGSGGCGDYQPDPFASNEVAPSNETEDVSNIYRSEVNSPMVTNPMVRKAAGGGGGGAGGARASVDSSISIGVGSDEFEEEDLKSSAQQQSR